MLRKLDNARTEVLFITKEIKDQLKKEAEAAERTAKEVVRGTAEAAEKAVKEVKDFLGRESIDISHTRTEHCDSEYSDRKHTQRNNCTTNERNSFHLDSKK